MGLFDMFKKKECDICGGEIGLLGNRKLEDGNMCKECAAKLSPWFSDRRSSTIAEINEQLEYREANKEKVAAFRATRTLGERTKVMIDEDAGCFMVTAERNLREANPDVLALSDITGCILDIDESEQEIMRQGKDGERESYNPPRYDYYYDFYIVIHVRNPYFDEIRFKLNNSRIEIESSRMEGYRRGGSRPMGRPNRGSGMDRFNNQNNSGDLGQALGQMLGSALIGAANAAAGTQQYSGPELDVDYRRYKEMGEEIRDALLQVRQQVRDQVVAANAPKAAVTCPYCGATTTPNASGCCEFCGGAING